MKWLIGGLWVVAIIGFVAWWSRKRFKFGTRELAENDDELRERMERMRDAGSEVGLETEEPPRWRGNGSTIRGVTTERHARSLSAAQVHGNVEMVRTPEGYVARRSDRPNQSD